MKSVGDASEASRLFGKQRPGMIELPPGPYAKQPFKAYYIVMILLGSILWRPYWAVRHLLGLQPYPRSWSLKQGVQVQVMRYLSSTIAACDLRLTHQDLTRLPDPKNLKETRAIWIPPAPASYIKGIADTDLASPIRMPGIVWSRANAAKDSDADPATMKVGPSDKVVLFLHGGGLAVGNGQESDVTGEIPRNIIKRCPSVNYVLTVEYRQVQDGPFPTTLIDCISGYAYLVEALGVDPSRLIVAGDSAGGHLTLALTRYLRDELKHEQLPRALLLCSPWCDMSKDLGPKQFMAKANSEIDFLRPDALQPFIAYRLLGPNPISLLDSPWLSSAGSTVPATRELFEGFPQSLITCGGVEVLRDQIEELVRRFELSKVPCDFYLEPDAVHDFEMLTFVDPDMRERVWKHISKWVEKCFA